MRVLSPPTLEQHPAIKSQRDKDPDEFWMLYKRLLAHAAAAKLIGDVEPPEFASPEGSTRPAASRLGPIGPTRWLIERIGRQQANSFLRIVRILDSALNNTSFVKVKSR